MSVKKDTKPILPDFGHFRLKNSNSGKIEGLILSADAVIGFSAVFVILTYCL